MGGINHQPCRNYMEKSTALSRSVSEAYSSLWDANIGIEDIILAELSHKKSSSYNAVLASLEHSVDSLGRADNDFNQLLQKMNQLHFDLKPATINFKHITEQWEQDGFIKNDVFWQEIVALYREGGFRNAIGTLQNKFIAVRNETRELLGVLTHHRQSVAEGSFMIDVEENKIPLRQYFAKTLTCWDGALSLFRYSSLISTELYLQDMGYPSLVDGVKSTSNSRVRIPKSIEV